MTYRILAGVFSAGIVAAGTILVGISVVAAPLEGAPARPAAASQPLVNPGHPVPSPMASTPTRGPIVGNFHPRAFRGLRPQNQVLPGYPLWWGYAGYGPSDYPPADYAASYQSPVVVYPPPSEDFRSYSRPQVFYEPGCRTDTQTVPSENGGERTITITRCY